MCLTESHAGSDLGLIRTKAEPNADGSYAISGEKIFISAGEHDLTENIVHIVLARLPDAPAGTKGISLLLCQNLILMRREILQIEMQCCVHQSSIKWGFMVTPPAHSILIEQ